MKNLIFILFMGLSIKGSAQVIADPALNLMRVATADGTTLDPFNIPLDNVIKLKVPVYNKDLINGLPSGTCKVKIGLGSKMIVDPAFDLTTVHTSNYFQWTAVFFSGQVQITGELIAPLPANYYDTAVFDVKGSILGNSTITTNFLVTNHNTTTILSDEDPTNNTSFLAYTVVEAPIPVTFTKNTVTKDGCTIKVDFDAEKEVNVNRYEIEISKDGIQYDKIGQLNANNLIHYHYNFAITDAIKSNVLYVRIKSIDMDGKFQYSETKTVGGNCDKSWGVSLYPNPVAHDIKLVTITAGDAIFNGMYTISLFDMLGKLINKNVMRLVNVKQFNYQTAHLASGQYLIKLQNNNGTQSAVLKLQKL